MKDHTGQRFGRLVVTKRAANNRYGEAMWFCQCDGGQQTTVWGAHLRRGDTKSCGCWQRQVAAARRLTHGHARRGRISRIYRIWRGMMRRCTYPNAVNYAHYGGRGITVCKRWRKFDNFLKDMGEPPLRHQIDRIDNDKGYCKSNCRWVTRKANGQNKRNNRLITFRGCKQCTAAWAEEAGIKLQTLHERLRRGWSIEEALTRPAKAREGRVRQ